MVIKCQNLMFIDAETKINLHNPGVTLQLVMDYGVPYHRNSLHTTSHESINTSLSISRKSLKEYVPMASKSPQTTNRLEQIEAKDVH